MRCLPLILSLALACPACVDVTPSFERDQIVVLAPELVRSALDSALAASADLQTRNHYRVLYLGCAELARRANAGDASLAITLHPAWADSILERTGGSRRPVASDRLVVAGGSLSGLGPLPDPASLLTLPVELGMPSTESASAGMYSREALIRLGLWSRIEGRLTPFTTAESVLQALTDGRLAAGFIFESAAREADLPVVLTLDPAFHMPILIEALLLQDEPIARSLFDYLGGAGQTFFVSTGFRPANP